MRKILGVSAAALLLAACGSETEGTFETDDGETGSYSIDSDGGESNITITGDDGEQFTLNTGSDVEVDLPLGFTVYPGGSVVTNTTITQGDGAGSMVIITTPDSAEDIMAFYRSQAEAAGIEINMEMSSNGTVMLGGGNEGGATFSLSASPGEDGTTAQLLVGQGLSD